MNVLGLPNNDLGAEASILYVMITVPIDMPDLKQTA